jgi:hypothetical protein
MPVNVDHELDARLSAVSPARRELIRRAVGLLPASARPRILDAGCGRAGVSAPGPASGTGVDRLGPPPDATDHAVSEFGILLLAGGDRARACRSVRLAARAAPG